MGDNKSLIIAVVLSAIVLLGWHYLYEKPHQEEQKRIAAAEKQESRKIVKTPVEIKEEAVIPRDSALQTSPRIKIRSPELHGSISLRGARFDDLTLANYKQTIEKDSAEVVLLSPSGSKDVYFGEFGWLAQDGKTEVPNAKSLWRADREFLEPGKPVTLTWANSKNVRFIVTISLDQHFMFNLKKTVQNKSGETIQVAPYGLVNRAREDGTHYYILHEGLIGALGGELQEVTYTNIREEKSKETKTTTGWVGITDKYWLTAIIPAATEKFAAKFSYNEASNNSRYQADYIGTAIDVPANSEISTELNFFAGAKKVTLLDMYEKDFTIPLFDRAVDFGWFYFLTKPMFHALNYFYSHTGNFGVAILILTVFVKLLMFPLAYKSYTAMSKMKLLQPEIAKLKESYKAPEDRMRFNKEVMEIYKRNKVNPLSGCLPLLVQIPVFFSLYKVIFVTLEMRHAPFFGWIKDLSAPDPTTVFNLFGLIPWTPPSVLMIGIWPLIMGATMVLQQRLNPDPADPIQAKMFKIMPYIFIFILAPFPAGLVIYWSWSNFLSIIQQMAIAQKLKIKKPRKAR